MRKGDYLGTFSGKRFYPLDPQPEDVHLQDIIHALSNICRFNGHTNRFYSVGEHSLNVAWLLEKRGADPKTVLYGLLHDAAEAYICDIPRPLKKYLCGYKEMETAAMNTIYEALKLPKPTAEQEASIASADKYILTLEARELMEKFEDWDLVEADSNDRLPHWEDVLDMYSAKLRLMLCEEKEGGLKI